MTAADISDVFILVQLSDLHLGATWADKDPVAGLSVTVEAVRQLKPRADAVVVSGDLADNATEAEYEQVHELLDRLDTPLYVLPGNHDDRKTLRQRFALPGAGSDPIRYAADLGALRLVVLDTTRPGEDAGALDKDQLDWLESELDVAPSTPTVLAMHHPPLVTGVPDWDEICLPEGDRQALNDALERHPEVQRIVAGHLHCTLTGELAGRPVLVSPSTYVQAQLDFASREIKLTAEPPGFAVHAFIAGRLISHNQSVS